MRRLGWNALPYALLAVLVVGILSLNALALWISLRTLPKTPVAQEIGDVKATLKATRTLVETTNQIAGKVNQSFDPEAITRLERSQIRISENIADTTSTLNQSLARNAGQYDRLIVSLSNASSSLAVTVASLQKVAEDPRMHESIVMTARSLEKSTQTLSEILTDVRRVSGDTQTQAQLRDSIARLDASTQKLNYLLGSVGGRSNVHGIDPVSAPHLHQTMLAGDFHSRLSMLAKMLVQNQVRIGALSTAAGGHKPQIDMNTILLPYSSTSLLLGANDIGVRTTYNLAAMKRVGRMHVGAGVLYSRLGILADGQKGRLGFETRLYDPSNPSIDAYGRAILTERTELFGGERDALHASRRTVIGVQMNF